MEKMWSTLAEHYDLMYDWKPYRTESRTLVQLIRRAGKSRENHPLDVACGSGEHLKHLTKFFRITGVDNSSAMLKIARKKLPGIRFHQQDMMRLNLGRQFDVILWLFAGIA